MTNDAKEVGEDKPPFFNSWSKMYGLVMGVLAVLILPVLFIYPTLFMSNIDWIVLFGTLISIVAYGVWKTRGKKDMDGYLRGGSDVKWWAIGLSIMATQASAITFLSTPGQAYNDGMGFIQFYFGLPLAMILIAVFFLPIYYKLKVYTAYEYLETRFDMKTRMLAAFIFLIQRGLGAGITIYAPSIILSSLLGWDLRATNIIIGVMVIIYTPSLEVPRPLPKPKRFKWAL